jgi:hypothetical protein
MPSISASCSRRRSNSSTRSKPRRRRAKKRKRLRSRGHDPARTLRRTVGRRLRASRCFPKVADLAAHVATITDADALLELMQRDTRKTAAPIYEARFAALTASAE